MGVVDRRLDHPHADRARAAHGAADPLDAGAPGARAGDEGDPAEVQGRPGEAERRADEVLQGEQHQPGRVVPAAARAVPGLHRPLLHAEARHEAHPGVVAACRPEHLRQGDRALVGLRAARDLRGLADRIDLLHGHHDGQDAADDHDVPAAGLPDRRLAVPDRAHPLLDDDQPLDGRAGPRHTEARAEAGRTRQLRPPVRNARRGTRPRQRSRPGTARMRPPRRRSPRPRSRGASRRKAEPSGERRRH